MFILGGQRIDQKRKKGWKRGIKIWFFQANKCIIKKKICHGVKQCAKICAIGEQNVIN